MKPVKNIPLFRSLLLILLLLFSACSTQAPTGGGGANGDVDALPGGSTSGGNPANGGSTSAGNPIRSLTVDLSGAIGLALDNSSQAGLGIKDVTLGSILKKVKPDNTLTDAITAGNVSVRSFMIAANNQIYLLLATPIESCILVRVDGATNAATCVDSSITNVVWNSGFLYRQDPIQFDGAGAIYYMFTSSNGNLVLRRNDSGVITDLINDNIQVSDFLVLPDGSIFLTGKTLSTGVQWVRKISPDDSLENVFASAEANFLSVFPDGNVYMGIWASPVFGVARYLTSDGLLEAKRWITTDINDLQEPRYFDCNAVSNAKDFTEWCGSFITALHRTIDNKVYVVAGNGGGGVLMQYYPNVEQVTTSVETVTAFQGVLSSLILAGLDQSNRNRLVLHDTKDESEIDLLNSEDIEAYHINFLASDNRIVFDGLRFSDNRYVICQVDLVQGAELTCAKTGLLKLSDFQSFR